MKFPKYLFLFTFLMFSTVANANSTLVKSIEKKINDATARLNCESEQLADSLTDEEIEFILDNRDDEKLIERLTCLQFVCLKSALSTTKEPYGDQSEIPDQCIPDSNQPWDYEYN
ncbi:MAG: hypothetical protein R2827_03575 [Bdellovibrionales bacterium]